MGDGKEKWFRFEDGLEEGGAVSDNELTYKNRDSYKEFHKWCVNQKPAEERRVILIFLEEHPDKGNKRKKDREIDENENHAKKLLFESIMKSCSIHKVDGRKFLTVLAVRCEDSDIKNAARLTEFEMKIEKRKECSTVGSARKVLDDGGRIVDNSTRSLWEKYVLIEKDVWESANSQIKTWLTIGKGLLFRFWSLILPVLYYVTGKFQEKIMKPYEIALIILSVVYFVIYNYCKKKEKDEKEKAKEKIREEIRYFRSFDYPVIFYNGTGKTTGWMKNYIHRYIEGEKEEEPKELIFYIGESSSELKIHEFIIPEGHPEWGLICLCKLVRDLADNPWGEIWSGTAITDKLKGEPVFSPSLEADIEHNISDPQLQIFKMPKDEENLRQQIEKKKNWHFARDPSSEDPVSRLFPIGDSVYAIRKNISWSDFKSEAFKIQGKVMSEINGFAKSIEYQFWLIQVVEKEREVIDWLNVISSRPTWDNALWKGIWRNIIQLLKNSKSEEISKLCDIVWDEKKDESQTSFVEYRNFLENSQKEEVDKVNSDQEEFVKQRTRT